MTCPNYVNPFCTIAVSAKYDWTGKQRHALRAALMRIVVTSLCLATIIAIITEGLRRRAAIMGKGAA